VANKTLKVSKTLRVFVCVLLNPSALAAATPLIVSKTLRVFVCVLPVVRFTRGISIPLRGFIGLTLRVIARRRLPKQSPVVRGDCFASLAMTVRSVSPV
jgi:hypothetical protein